jgi:hypothetical protein
MMEEEEKEYVDIRMQQPPTIPAKPELEDEVNTFLDELERGIMMDWYGWRYKSWE